MLKSLSLPVHFGLALLAWGGQQLALSWVNGSYERSRHPVDFMTGQTAFDAAAVKGWYAAMIEAGTFDIYFRTQLIDFVFIASMLVFGYVAGTFVARLALPGGWAAKIGMAAAFLIPLGAGFDAIENLISFVMIADPVEFAAWIALPYSGFAVAKFGAIGLGYIALALSLLVNLPERVLRR